MTVERAAELLSTVSRGVASTGAGASAESGIPTFRGAGGLWTKYDPVKVASIAEVVIHGRAGEVLPTILSLLGA